MSTLSLHRSRLSAVMACCALAAAPACAQSNAQGLHDNSFVLNGGVFVFTADIKARLDGEFRNNQEIDFDESFGKADDSRRGRADLLWRINPKHHLRFLYFDNSNRRTKTIDEDLAWGDYVFQANAAVDVDTTFKVYALAYEYAFLRTPSYEVSASFGAHVTDLSLALSASGNVTGPGGQPVSDAVTETGDLLAPLPMVGLRAGWVVLPNWYLDAQAQVFALSTNGWSGSWSDIRVGATWMFHKNFGIGLGWNRFANNVDVEKSSFKGSLKLRYSGVQAYLTGTF